MFVLEHLETTVQQNRSRQRKTEKKEEQKRVSSGKDCSVGNGGAKSKISPRKRLEGIDEKESDRVREKERKREREKEKEKRIRVSTHLYPPPSDVCPRTSRTSVGDLYLRCDVRRCDDGEG